MKSRNKSFYRLLFDLLGESERHLLICKFFIIIYYLLNEIKYFKPNMVSGFDEQAYYYRTWL